MHIKKQASYEACDCPFLRFSLDENERAPYLPTTDEAIQQGVVSGELSVVWQTALFSFFGWIVRRVNEVPTSRAYDAVNCRRHFKPVKKACVFVARVTYGSKSLEEMPNSSLFQSTQKQLRNAGIWFGCWCVVFSNQGVGQQAWRRSWLNPDLTVLQVARWPDTQS